MKKRRHLLLVLIFVIAILLGSIYFLFIAKKHTEVSHIVKKSSTTKPLVLQNNSYGVQNAPGSYVNGKETGNVASQGITVVDSTFDDEAFINTINGYRILQGIPGLVRNTTLDDVAKEHALDMRERGYYEHTSPEGVTADSRINAAFGHQTYNSESIDVLCSYVDATNQFNRLLSTDNKDNILDPAFRYIGVGYALSKDSACNGFLTVTFSDRL